MSRKFKIPLQLQFRGNGVCGQCNHLLAICMCQKHETSSLFKHTYNLFGYELFEGSSSLSPLYDLELDPGYTLDNYHNCKKKEYHKDFVPVVELNTSHLPEELRHPTVCVWLRASARLVVKLKRSREVATGRVSLDPSEEKINKLCDDINCIYKSKLGQVHKVHGGLTIITNKHVVSSDEIAAQTRVKFFYDRNESDEFFFRFEELGTNLLFALEPLDYSVFSCYVHSKKFIDVMKLLKKAQDYSWQQIPENLRELSKKYAITISHPHGVHKQISIGLFLSREMRVSDTGKGDEVEHSKLLSKLFESCKSQGEEGSKRIKAYLKFIKVLKTPVQVTKYSAATCGGSSGAPVYVGDFEIENGRQLNIPRTHRGVGLDDFYNYSHA